MNKNQLRNLIERTLKEVDGFYSEEAVNLLMGTSAQESHLGEYIRQIKGPALGIFQMEPATFRDILDWLRPQIKLYSRIFKAANISSIRPEILEYNLKAAILLTRIHYLRKPGKLPDTIEGMAWYWKQWYNTPLGAGTEAEFIANYKRFVE